MTTDKTNIFVSHSASSKSVNSTLKGFGGKLKNYIVRSAIKENQDVSLPLPEDTDSQKFELECQKNMAYGEFSEHIYCFLSEHRTFSIKYLNSFKARILKEKKSLFSQNENLKMLFQIDLVIEIGKLKRKMAKNKESFYNQFMEADMNEMIYKLYNIIPENVLYRLEGDRMQREEDELEEKVKELFPNNPEAQENYLAFFHGFYL